MLILGIETSCDETAVALYHDQHGLLGHCLHSQISLHQPYGGVIPELASRDHIRRLAPLTQSLLETTHHTYADLTGIAYTRGPGLLGALLVGSSFAKSLAFSLNIPALGIHHLESHLFAPFLEDTVPRFPFLALLVSGGHTLLIHVAGLGQYTILGETVDDSAGEAFDKTAKMLGLSYPGGPQIAKLATQGQAGYFNFPKPMLHSGNLNFSFSGLKTHALQTWQKCAIKDNATKAHIAHAFQEAVVATLIHKTKLAVDHTDATDVVIAGGVSANQELRTRMRATLGSHINIFYPRPEFCTDNGAMVAYTGYLRFCAGQTEDRAIQCRARWPISEI